MNEEELLIGSLIEDIEFEDEYRIVKKVIGEIKTGVNSSKRVSEVIWKSMNSSIPQIDIRHYNYKTKRYHKGISFSQYEAKQLLEFLKEYFDLT